MSYVPTFVVDDASVFNVIFILSLFTMFPSITWYVNSTLWSPYILVLLSAFIVIFLGTFDMFKAVTGGDEKSMVTSGKKLGIRALIGLSIFLVPSIIHIVLSTLNDYNAISDDANVCQTCLLKPSSCEDGVPSDINPFDEDIFDHTPVEEENEDEEQSGDEEVVVE